MAFLPDAGRCGFAHLPALILSYTSPNLADIKGQAKKIHPIPSVDGQARIHYPASDVILQFVFQAAVKSGDLSSQQNHQAEPPV